MNAVFAVWTLATIFSAAALADIPARERASIDRIIGTKGAYIVDDDVYKIVLPRDAAIVQDYQTLSPNLGINSWVAFSPAIHTDAIIAGEFLVLDDEVNPVLAAVVDAGLEVTALAVSSVFEGPRFRTLHISGRGTFQSLAAAFRKGLDEVRHVRSSPTLGRSRFVRPSVPIESAIDGRPLDSALSMRGTVVRGAYRAAIGKRASIHGEVVGREMGVSTWVSFGGTNERAIANGEFGETPKDLQKVLKALMVEEINIESIRGHMLGEHPEFVFVRFWCQGTALELAKALRYVLDVEVGAIRPGAKI